MSLILYATIAWITIYSLVALVAWRTDRVPDYLTVQGPILLIHTDKGKKTIEKCARAVPRFWKIWGVGGVIFAGITLLGGAVLVAQSAIAVFTRPEATRLASDPTNLVVIPGVNNFIPLESAPALTISMLIALVAHELGHAIYCRTGDIEIKSTGLALLALVPVGAFVEPDEQSKDAAPRWEQLKMVSAGVMNNFALTLVTLGLLIVVASTVIVPASGGAIGGVLEDSPADNSGLEAGDRIVSVSGVSVTSNEETKNVIKETSAPTLRVETSDGDVHMVNREVFAVQTPEMSSIAPETTITHVNGDTVSTERQFQSAIDGVSEQTVTLTLENGEKVTYPVGALVTLSDESPLKKLAAKSDQMVITHVDGKRIRSATALESHLSSIDGEGKVNIQALSGDSLAEPVTGTVTVNEPSAKGGMLGISMTSGIAGLSVADFGIRFYPVQEYLSYIGGGDMGVLRVLLFIVFLPFGAMLGLPHNFVGFTSSVESFFTVIPAVQSVEGLVLFSSTVLFWSVWLNVNLALTNCIPTYLLDGGHYLSLTVESIVRRTNLPNPKRTSSLITKGILCVALVALLTVVVVPAIIH